MTQIELEFYNVIIHYLPRLVKAVEKIAENTSKDKEDEK